jgi:DNA processing protein
MTKDSVYCQRESIIDAYLRLDAIPKIGIKGLSDTASAYQCDLLYIDKLSDKQLLTIGWSNEQVQCLRTPNAFFAASKRKVHDWLNRSASHHFVALTDPAYPPLLQQLTRPPLFLFIAGNVEIISQPQLAMVGTRAPSQYAKEVVDDLVSGISERVAAHITSGMALGIDGLSHRASIHYNIPTIAVLGCGIDIAYPKRHRQLFHDIQQQGAVVSEFLPSTAPHASLFPRRNRIISGLSMGVIVVEAKIKSGSLVTARYALEQNKEVFAVPSAIYNPNSEGCHYLIKSGAKLTENADDILEELPFLAKPRKISSKDQNSLNQRLASDPLLDSVSYSAVSVDLIAKRTGMPVSDVLTQLLQYELRGIVASTPEGYVKLRG